MLLGKCPAIPLLFLTFAAHKGKPADTGADKAAWWTHHNERTPQPWDRSADRSWHNNDPLVPPALRTGDKHTLHLATALHNFCSTQQHLLILRLKAVPLCTTQKRNRALLFHRYATSCHRCHNRHGQNSQHTIINPIISYPRQKFNGIVESGRI